MRYALLLLLLAGCAASPGRQACLEQYPAPPSPNAERGAYAGLIGALIGGMIDERKPQAREWRANMDNCQRGYANASN